MGQRKEHSNLIKEHLKKQGTPKHSLPKSYANFTHLLGKLCTDNYYECLRLI